MALIKHFEYFKFFSRNEKILTKKYK